MPIRYLLIASTFLMSMLLYVDRVCISAAKAAVSTDLGLSDKQFGWVLSAFALGYALLQTPAGVLADRYGPRRILTAVVAVWSAFTALTAAAQSFAGLLAARFLFGAGEAGAFPGCARAFYAWLPMSERGLAQGINFSGSRLGAAFALPAVAAMIAAIGWRTSFVVLALAGFVWAAAWYVWFKDDPTDHPGLTADERDLILRLRQPQDATGASVAPLTVSTLLRARNMWLAMAQYFASNFTFFFCLTWLHPHLSSTYHLDPVWAGVYASAPLVAGAVGNWVGGGLVDYLYRSGRRNISRRWPAMLGFGLAACGLVGSASADSATGAVFALSIAVFGADMTLPPSWSFCIDIGGRHAGAVSGTMNMAGNLGSFVTSLAFPYLRAWTGSAIPFFIVGATLNALAIWAWALTKADRHIEES